MNKKKSVATARLEPTPSNMGFAFESSALPTAITEVMAMGLFQIYKIYIEGVFVIYNMYWYMNAIIYYKWW